VEEEQEPLDEEELNGEEERHYDDEMVGVMDLLQDPHSQADIGLATSFALQ
jgi:hypothetical protein